MVHSVTGPGGLRWVSARIRGDLRAATGAATGSVDVWRPMSEYESTAAMAASGPDPGRTGLS